MLNITCDEVRLNGMFDEDILTNAVLNSPEYIPLGESEGMLALSKSGRTYDELSESEKGIFKIAVLENIRSKCCIYMSVYILNEAKKVDKADIKYEKYATVQDWKNEAQAHLSKYNNYMEKITETSNVDAGIACSVLVDWR